MVSLFYVCLFSLPDRVREDPRLYFAGHCSHKPPTRAGTRGWSHSTSSSPNKRACAADTFSFTNLWIIFKYPIHMCLWRCLEESTSQGFDKRSGGKKLELSLKISIKFVCKQWRTKSPNIALLVLLFALLFLCIKYEYLVKFLFLKAWKICIPFLPESRGRSRV